MARTPYMPPPPEVVDRHVRVGQFNMAFPDEIARLEDVKTSALKGMAEVCRQIEFQTQAGGIIVYVEWVVKGVRRPDGGRVPAGAYEPFAEGENPTLTLSSDERSALSAEVSRKPAAP